MSPWGQQLGFAGGHGAVEHEGQGTHRHLVWGQTGARFLPSSLSPPQGASPAPGAWGWGECQEAERWTYLHVLRDPEPCSFHALPPLLAQWWLSGVSGQAGHVLVAVVDQQCGQLRALFELSCCLQKSRQMAWSSQNQRVCGGHGGQVWGTSVLR